MTDDVAIVVAGARGAAVRSLIGALLARVSPLPRTSPESFLALRHGVRRQAFAYVPGYREPHPYPAGLAGLPRDVGRPPRRVDAILPEALLAYVSMVAAPELNEEHDATTRVLIDLLDRGAGLVLVTDGRYPFRTAELDLLREAATRTDGVFLAVVHPDEGEGWADVVMANQNSLARHVPELAMMPWFPVARRRPDVADLRRSLVEWAGEQRARRTPTLGPRTMRIQPEAHASGWEELMEEEIAVSRRELDVRLAAELAELQDRCADRLGNPKGPAQLPFNLDRELHAFSVRVTAELRGAADAVLQAVLTPVVTELPDPRTLGRVRAALRRRIVEADRASADPDWDHALLVTGTAAVAMCSGEGAFASVAAYVGEREQPVLAPVGIALTANCYSLWPEAPDGGVAARRAWLHRAIASVQRELSRELTRQFDDLRRGLTELIADGIEHGLMLV